VGDFLDAPWTDVATALTGVGVFAQVPGVATLPLIGDSGGSVVGMTFDATVAWPAYDWMGVAKAGLESHRSYLARSSARAVIRVNLVAADPCETIAAKSIPGFVTFEDAWTDARAARLGQQQRRAVAPWGSPYCSRLADRDNGRNVHVDAATTRDGRLIGGYDDAVALSFGSRSARTKVLPFLRNVTRGPRRPR
jgi:enoyl-[acyl-carrier protein] reductase I